MYPSLITLIVTIIMVNHLVQSSTENSTTIAESNLRNTSTIINHDSVTSKVESRAGINIPIPRDYLNNTTVLRRNGTAIRQTQGRRRRYQSMIKRMDDKEVDEEREPEESKLDNKVVDSEENQKVEGFETKSIKLQPALTIPLKNAIIQELQPIDRHEAAAATAARQHQLQDNIGIDDGVSGEIVYEDELGGELSDWMPPPPPPPPELSFRRRPFSSPSFFAPSSSSSALSSLFQPGASTRLFGDDFALFLVILTIAGFFGLMLAMFMPFTFLMQQQLPVGGYPVGIGGGGLGIGGIGGYPGAGVQSGYGGYPPYGRRRRKRTISKKSKENSSLVNDYHDLERDFIRIMAGIDEFISNYYKEYPDHTG